MNTDRKSTRLNSSHLVISYAVFCLKKKQKDYSDPPRHYGPTADMTPPLFAIMRNSTHWVCRTTKTMSNSIAIHIFFFFFILQPPDPHSPPPPPPPSSPT